MARTKAFKKEIGGELKEKFAPLQGAIIAEYRGVSAEDLRSLRVELRKVDSSFLVVKNRVAKKAIEGSESVEAMSPLLKGPVGVASLSGDVAQGAKVLLEFAKSNKAFKVTGGVLDGKIVGKDDIKAISDLPSKEVLIAKVLGSITAPHRGLVSVINGVNSKLVRVLSAIKDQKQ